MGNFPIFLLSTLLLLPLLASCTTQKQMYIVYFGEHKGDKTHQEIEDNHHSYLLSVKESEEDAKSSLLYSYKHSINGFSAVLTPNEASQLSDREEVISVYPSIPHKYELHTTRSWEFSGVHETRNLKGLDKEDLLLKSRYGKDVIVGMVDSGVWPESKSFNDAGMGPIPKRWKGICQSGVGFDYTNCNKKIIGARYYIRGFEQYYGALNRSTDYLSPRDKDGHGTHTASTAAGRRVKNVSALGGFARGTASGGAPLARLAIYKACWAIPNQEKANGNTCFDVDMLAAVDDAIADGVDVLSISIGTKEPTPFHTDGLAVGALHAIKNNIVVAMSAGNSGPKASTLSNPAPWIITVAASSVDRKFVSSVVLGNSDKIEGQTVAPYHLEKRMYPLVYAAQVESSHVPKNLSGQCMPGSLSVKAKGKIVLCMRGNGTRIGKGVEVKRAGGAGYILANGKLNGGEIVVDAHVLPATALTYEDGQKLLKYINSAKSASVGYLTPATTEYGVNPAPFMAEFSSRGPSTIAADILKPDITAPGLNILAAWSEADSPTKTSTDPRRVKYNVLSGTSMSCPHIGGSAALLKAIHPTWSSAAIRSAIMTTAGVTNSEGKTLTDASGNPANPFQFGAGHFRPSKAADPGLVYDASYTDYLLFLCSIKAQNLDKSFKCPTNPPSAGNLNYPSLSIPKLKGTMTFTRTVTNVGGSGSVYFASAKPPRGISVKISPPILFFKHVGEKKKFTITVKAKEQEGVIASMKKGEYAFGWYTWNDGVHNVHSPMAVSLA